MTPLASGFMLWTAWNNGRYHRSGAGYGFRVDADDRDRHFLRSWGKVLVELPSPTAVAAKVNINKGSFRDRECRELISKEVGMWMIQGGHAPWPTGSPPKFRVRLAGPRRFEVLGLAQ